MTASSLSLREYFSSIKYRASFYGDHLIKFYLQTVGDGAIEVLREQESSEPLHQLISFSRERETITT